MFVADSHDAKDSHEDQNGSKLFWEMMGNGPNEGDGQLEGELCLKPLNIIKYLARKPNTHFTGYASIQSEFAYHGLFNYYSVYMQFCVEERVSYTIILVDVEKRTLSVIKSSGANGE